MPRYWHDPMALKRPDGDDPAALATYELNRRIVADRKPYFMRYVYPALMRDYRQYLKDTDAKCLSKYRMTVSDLEAIPEEERSEDQGEFLRYYYMKMPVGISDCVMNRICRKVEQAFESPIACAEGGRFDYGILKANVGYADGKFTKIRGLYDECAKHQRTKSAARLKRRNSDGHGGDYAITVVQRFCREAERVCSNEDELMDVVLDVCYGRESTKQFVWDTVGRSIVRRLLKKNNNEICFPVEDPDGDISYFGERFSMLKVGVGKEWADL